MIDASGNIYSRFIVNDDDEMTGLELIKKLQGNQTILNDELKNKTDLYGNHLGSWHGVPHPVLSDPGISGVVIQVINNKIYVSQFNDLYLAIEHANINGGIVELEQNKTYICNSQLVVDISKVKINGNGAILDFSSADDSLECIKIIGTEQQYLSNSNYIRDLKIFGSGMTGNQIAIVFNSTEMEKATSHIELYGLTIKDFKIGIEYRSFTYLIRHINTDIYNCTVCVNLPDGYTDYGENINFYGCTLYNSETGVVGRGSAGNIHMNSCSIDYCNIISDFSNECRFFFNNGHIETGGYFKGFVVCSDTNLVLLNNDVKFDTLDNQPMTFNNCRINSNCTFTDIVLGYGKVTFNGCVHPNISDFVTNRLNPQSSSCSQKAVDIYGNGTEPNIDMWNATNILIEHVGDVLETGTHATKITKTYGTGSNCTFNVLLKRKNVENTRFNIRMRVKASVPITTNEIDFNLRLCKYATGTESNGMPKLLEIERNHNYKHSIGIEWQWIDFIGNQVTLDKLFDTIEIQGNLFNWDGSGRSIWIDRIEYFEY